MSKLENIINLIEPFINRNKIVILFFPKYIHIEFLEKKLEWIHKKLHITTPKKSDSSKGGIILNSDEISSVFVV